MKKGNRKFKLRVQRGDIYLADLDPGVGSEQKGTRPVLVLQNNVGNRFSPTIIIAPITGHIHKGSIPTHVLIKEEISGLEKDSNVLLEQIRTIDKQRLITKLGERSKVALMDVEEATRISLGLDKKEEI